MNEPDNIPTLDQAQTIRAFDPQNQLGPYFRWLTKENDRINLVSRETIQDGLSLLAFESLVPLDRINTASIRDYLDIGSGGGFPAIPIMLALISKGQPCRATLVERTQKKCGALRRIGLRLDLDRADCRFDLLNQSFEDCLFHREFDLITLRYVTLTSELLEKIKGLLKPRAVFVYYSVPQFEIECDDIEAVTHYYRVASIPQRKAFTIFTKK